MRPKKSKGLGSIYVGGVRFNFDVAQKHQCAELVTVNVTVNFGALGANLNRTSQVPFRRPDASDQEHKPFPQSAINETLGVLKMDLVSWTRTFYLLHEKPRVADL
jgi:hypothetical protein